MTGKKKRISKALLQKREKRKEKREFKEAWLEARRKCLERDNYECQICGNRLDREKLRGMAIHHIIPRQYRELFLELDNLITLCSRCHRWGKDSPHQNALWFAEWLRKNKQEQYNHLRDFLNELAA